MSSYTRQTYCFYTLSSQSFMYIFISVASLLTEVFHELHSQIPSTFPER